MSFSNNTGFHLYRLFLGVTRKKIAFFFNHASIGDFRDIGFKHFSHSVKADISGLALFNSIDGLPLKDVLVAKKIRCENKTKLNEIGPFKCVDL